MFVRSLLAAAVVFAGGLIFTPDAEARGRWWRARSARPSANTYVQYRRSLEPSRRVVYSGISRAEQDRQRNLDAWYDHAWNGFRPEDFR